MTSPSRFTVLSFDHLASTSDHAKQLAAEGAVDGTIVRATTQSAGRGRQGRAWVSPVGNLYMSLLLRPRVSAMIATELGFVSAIAAADCIDSFLPPEARATLKWPNDIMVDRAKIGGILLEAQSSDHAHVDWVVVGIGLNIASHPNDARLPATSLAALGVDRPTVDDVFATLCRQLEAALDTWRVAGFEHIRAGWLARAHGVGEPASAAGVEGIFHDLDRDGALLLRTGREIRRITAGDVRFSAA